MIKTLKVFLITFVCVFVCFLGLRFGYDFIAQRKIAAPEIAEDVSEAAQAPRPAATIPEPRVKAGTRIVYEYISSIDGAVETSEESVPYFLIGKTRKDVAELYKDWRTLTFTEDLIVLRKTGEPPGGQKYVVGVLDGQIAVFYKNPVNGSSIKEITSSPVSALPREEQQKLLDGVEVGSEAELMQMLQDYGS
jgi:hypothetical protein